MIFAVEEYKNLLWYVSRHCLSSVNVIETKKQNNNTQINLKLANTTNRSWMKKIFPNLNEKKTKQISKSVKVSAINVVGVLFDLAIIRTTFISYISHWMKN